MTVYLWLVVVAVVVAIDGRLSGAWCGSVIAGVSAQFSMW